MTNGEARPYCLWIPCFEVL